MTGPAIPRIYLGTRGRPLILLLTRTAAALVLGWFLLAGGLAAARGLANATRPLAPGEVVAAAVGLAVVAWGARTAWIRGGADRGKGWRRGLPLAATSTAVILWGASLTRGGESPAAAAFFWLLLAGEEGWACWRTALEGRRNRPTPFQAPQAARQDRLVQEFHRFLTAEGEEIVRGSIAVTIEPGSRTAAGHVAFCPPLAQRPHLEVQPDATTKATLKVSQLYPHGARIEVRLPQAAQAETTLAVRFVARRPSGEPAVAD